MSSSLIFSLRETCISFGKKEIFKDLDVDVHKGDFIALIGKNGVGKSTLMRIISDKQDLDQGELWKQPGLQTSYFSQHFDLKESNTVERELANVLKSKDEQYKIDIFCKNLVLDKFAAIRSLSGGQKRRVGLIKALIGESDIVLLDEPTNHLDLECIIWLENYLKSYAGSIICVSHDRTFLSNFTNKVFWLDRGNLRVSPSGFKNFDRWSVELFEQEARQLKNRKQFVNIEVEWASRGVKARVKRNLKRLERAKQLKEQLEKEKLEEKKKRLERLEKEEKEQKMKEEEETKKESGNDVTATNTTQNQNMSTPKKQNKNKILTYLYKLKIKKNSYVTLIRDNLKYVT